MLEYLEIPQHYSVFVEEEAVTWSAIKTLSKEDLKDFGLKTGPRNMIFNYIEAKLSAETTAWAQNGFNPTAIKALLDASFSGFGESNS